MADTDNISKNTVNIVDKDIERRLLDTAEGAFLSKRF